MKTGTFVTYNVRSWIQVHYLQYLLIKRACVQTREDTFTSSSEIHPSKQQTDTCVNSYHSASHFPQAMFCCDTQSN